MTEKSVVPLAELDVEYARFNALKTVGSREPSEFSLVRVGQLLVTSDAARTGAYYNRVLGLTPASLPELDKALASLSSGPVRVDLDEPVPAEVVARLNELGFTRSLRLVWLVAPSRQAEPSVSVRRLGPDERDLVRDVLALEGEIDSSIWALRRAYQCTEQFRAFAVETDGLVASLGTTFVGSQGAVLGNAFTRVEYRGRGYQRALLLARLDDAFRLGLPWVVTDVEPDSTSHRNCERAGFETFCKQELWERGTATGPDN